MQSGPNLDFDCAGAIEATVRRGRTVVQAVLILVMTVALLASGVCCALGWAGLPVERLALASAGVALTATSLLLIGEALKPSWAGGRWNPPPGTLVSPPNRFTSLGASIWF